MNDFAKWIASQEGKAQSLSIAQIKEVIGLVADAVFHDTVIMESLLRIGRKRAGK
jgi:hypothetical protein